MNRKTVESKITSKINVITTLIINGLKFPIRR